MKRLAALLFALLCSVPSYAVDCKERITLVETDRFTGATKFYSRENVGYYSMTARFMGTQQKAGGPVIIGLVLSGTHEKWQFLDCNKTDVLLDGQPYKLPPLMYEPESGQGQGVVESLTAALTVEHLEALAKAETFEYRICGKEFKAPSYFKCQAQDVLRVVKSLQ